MAGRGPAPKLGPKLGHRAGDRKVTAPGDGTVKTWPLPPHPSPDGVWGDRAVDWWRLAVASPSAAAWTESDRAKLERLVWMVDKWWEMTVSSPTEAMRMADQVRRAEEELYLSPKARAQAGIVVDQAARDRHPSSGGGSRARLRAVASDAVVED